jgi:hypothetical protein
MIPTFLQPYAKAVVAIVGVAVLIGVHKANLTIPGLDSLILEILVGTLTGFGVYQVRNK